MKIRIEYNSNDEQYTAEAAVETRDYVLVIKEQLAKQEGSKIAGLIEEFNGPYDPSVRLIYKGIELNNMFHIEKYLIKEGDTIELLLGDEPASKEVPEVEKLVCSQCGKTGKDPAELRYHPGRLSPQAWVYGLTTHWEWSCCRKVVSTPAECYHPEGCKTGICPQCRKDCGCYQAREIRREEEEKAFD
ncbi:MAG: hypothetical protein GY754_32650 [bacterium]|nr:hypothetical protein [bacterium]